MKVAVPETPTPMTTTYNNFMGVDYSTDASLVNKRRTPDGKNMIPDSAGNPEKRKGWSVLHNVSNKIDNLWSFEVENVRYNLMTYGTNLVEFTDTEIKTPFTLSSTGKKMGIYSQNASTSGLFIFDDSRIIRAYPSVGAIAYEEITYYTPTVIIARNPVTGGGVAYENINMMTRRRKERFINSGTNVGSAWTGDSSTNTLTSATSHNLSVGDRVKFQVGSGVLPTGIDPTVTYYVKTATATNITISITSGGSEINITSDGTTGWVTLAASLSFLCTAVVSNPTVRYKDSSGTWQLAMLDSVSGATVNIVARHLGSTEDNIEIEYTAAGSTTATIICHCKQYARFNQTTLDRIFVTSCDLSGYGQYVYYCQYGDISYWPDQNYIYIGGSGSDIAGFLNVSDTLAVIKADNNQETTIYFLYETTLTITNQDGTTTDIATYGAKQTSAGIGAIGSCMGVLIDDPLFLTPYGVMGISSKSYTTEKIIRNRSVFINSRLTQESLLENAVSCVWKDFFLIFINDNVYILDSKQKTDNKDTGSYVYESYFWNNVPATTVMSFDGQLYFGGLVGTEYSLCKFYTSESSSSYNDNGVAITATWKTPNDNDNGTQYYKVMQKKGSMCTTKPYSQSSVKIYCSADGQERELIGSGNSSKGSFSGMSFSSGTFKGSSYPQDKFFIKKKKKYKRIQLIIENAELNQGFGLIEIVKTWYSTRYARS